MISEVVCNFLAAQLSLEVGKEIFAESAKGEKYVLVKTTYDRPWHKMGSQFRTSHVQVVVTGYSIKEGKLLSEKIVKHLEPMTENVVLGTETFDIRAVKPVGLPILAAYGGDFRAFSINFSISYVYELAE